MFLSVLPEELPVHPTPHDLVWSRSSAPSGMFWVTVKRGRVESEPDFMRSLTETLRHFFTPEDAAGGNSAAKFTKFAADTSQPA